jgi:hypothetical protein
MRMVLELNGRVTVDDLMEETKAELLTAFRNWKSA